MFPIIGSRGYLTGLGTVFATSISTGAITATGRVTGAGFTSSIDGSAGTPAYNYSSLPDLGMYRVSNYNSFAVGGVQKFVAGVEVAVASAIPFQAIGGMQLYSQFAANVTANQVNYNPAALSAYTYLELTPDAARAIDGFAGGTQGMTLLVKNAATTAGRTLSLTDASISAATAGNQVLTSSGLGTTIAPGALAIIRHNGTKWSAGVLS